jgi:Icc-related predicted phosphoesterase
VRVYAIADLHGNLPEPPDDAEALLIAGDICPDFRPRRSNHWDFVDKGGVAQAHWLESYFKVWLQEHEVPTAYIWGNHDFVGEKKFLIPKNMPGWRLQDDQITLHRSDSEQTLKIWGTPWVPNLEYWAFYGHPQALQTRANRIPGGLDVLMTHGPPVNAGDFIPAGSKYGNYGGEHVGDPTLNAAILRARPKVVICGHIHEARGAYVVSEAFEDGGVPVYNVSAVDENYVLHEQPWTRLYELD